MTQTALADYPSPSRTHLETLNADGGRSRMSDVGTVVRKLERNTESMPRLAGIK
jgi:hypothetical protein